MNPLRSIQLTLFAAAAALCHGTVLAADSYVFTTLAGVGPQGFANGVGTAAQFAFPEDIAVDSAGNLYVSDLNNGVIRKIAPDGTVTTLAGVPGGFGAVDGPAASARFGTLYGIALDAARNVYVADSYYCTIRRVSTSGTVNTLAGYPGKSGSIDGVTTSARFNNPHGIAIDLYGNMYVADSGNYVVRRISPDGTVTTIAGSAGNPGSTDGVGTAARFRYPYGIAVDGSGNVYVSDLFDYTIRKIAPDGTVMTLAGLPGINGTTNGVGTAARFMQPAFMKADASGNLYVGDRTGHAIRKVAPNGIVSTVAGSANVRGYRDGTTTTAQFFKPSGVAIDANGTLYVTDTYNCTIRTVNGITVTTVAGQLLAGTTDGIGSSARLFCPHGIAVANDGTVYFSDSYNQTIRKLAPGGSVTTIAGQAGTQGSTDGAAADARFRYPFGLALDGSGNLYVADNTNHTIRKITSAGVVSTIAGLARTPGSDDGVGTTARFAGPTDVKVDKDGNLYVADSSNHTIRRIASDGTVTTWAGAPGTAGNADGPAALARFYIPAGLAFDAAGNLFVADYGNAVIRKITPAGNVTTLAGTAGSLGTADGTGGDARFAGPSALTIGPDGNLFVVDTLNHTIRKVTPAGVVTTIGGINAVYWADGIGADAAFAYPYAIANDTAGNIYIADESNNAIRKGGQVGVASPTSRLFNLSVGATLAANDRLITGFVVSGGPKNMLVRAVGPGLAPYVNGVTTAGDPRLEIYDNSQALVQSNDNWGGSSSLSDTFASVGAFPLSPTSLDAAAVRGINGLHSVHVLSPSGGMVLVEAYDAGSGTTARLINVSAMYKVSSGNGALAAGFVIEGSNQKTVLIRGVGPTLTSFNVGGALADPKLELYNSDQRKIAENDNWASSLANTFTAVGAFQLVPGSKDAALLVSLPPGLYSARLTGADDGSGQGMVEVYEVGN